ncbi:MAG: type II secretion system protein [bacterium]
MNPIRRRSRIHLRRGFTLIEILTVVLILGILAALIVPNMTGFMSDATTSAARSQLAAVRGQIEMYKLRHGGVVPGVSGTDGTDLLFSAMTAPDDGQQPLLSANPKLPLGYTWNWDGSMLTVLYDGPDQLLVAEAPTW